jgi:AcrR family transcriptional regulator
MGIEDRKQREKENMRRLILDAAREIFLEKGYYQTSIRTIADKIEYSPGTIYLYFKEKDEIFLELHNEAFGQLLQQMAPLQAVGDAFERLVAMGRIYMSFALNNKDLYDLMFIMGAPMNMLGEACPWTMGDRVFDHLVHTVKECQATGRMPGKDPLELSFTIWSGLHGMCALYCRNRIGVMEHVDHKPVNEKEILEKSYGYYVDMLRNM